ncbi:hypothetical protein T484DRAFT_1903722 [Baffinella frigidus]|nr:hypothetical protein T484DRAFT_1903722 [Cryptophyta sp. CCMP2293]
MNAGASETSDARHTASELPRRAEGTRHHAYAEETLDPRPTAWALLLENAQRAVEPWAPPSGSREPAAQSAPRWGGDVGSGGRGSPVRAGARRGGREEEEEGDTVDPARIEGIKQKVGNYQKYAHEMGVSFSSERDTLSHSRATSSPIRSSGGEPESPTVEASPEDMETIKSRLDRQSKWMEKLFRDSPRGRKAPPRG